MKIKVAKIEISRIRLSGSDTVRVTEFHTLDYFKTNYFSYTLDTGRSYMYERGTKKVSDNDKIKSFKSLVSNLDKSSLNSCRDYQSTFYRIAEEGYIDSKDLVKDIDENSEDFQKLVQSI